MKLKNYTQLTIERVNNFNVVYQQFIAMYDSGCRICCNWSILQHTEVPCRR